MLPVARNRSFHVPHGLAAMAAAVCLVIAFTAEDPARADQLAGVTPEPCVQATAKFTTDAESEHSSPERGARSVEQRPVRHSSAIFIPWFPGR